MEGDKNLSLFLSPTDGRQQKPVPFLIAKEFKATRTGLFSYCQRTEGDKKRPLSLLPADVRRQETVSLLIANGWKATRTGLSSYRQQMESDKNRLLTHTLGNGGTTAAESIATLPPFGPIEGNKRFFQISSQ
jgi:hypothetical protein